MRSSLDSEPDPNAQRVAGEAASVEPEPYRLRIPTVDDGPAMWRLVRDSTLDDNSPYAYLMLARYYPQTCRVAEATHTESPELAGLVTAFVPPAQPDTLFVWQVGVRPEARGHGLARRLIQSVLHSEACAGVRQVEATVTPSNAASLALFRGLADRLGTQCTESTCFPARLFPGGQTSHEEEWLLRVGPFTSAHPQPPPKRST